MKFIFNGDYTGGRDSVSAWGIVFNGREPSEVPAELVEKFERHVEFKRVKLSKKDSDNATG